MFTDNADGPLPISSKVVGESIVMNNKLIVELFYCKMSMEFLGLVVNSCHECIIARIIRVPNKWEFISESVVCRCYKIFISVLVFTLFGILYISSIVIVAECSHRRRRSEGMFTQVHLIDHLGLLFSLTSYNKDSQS